MHVLSLLQKQQKRQKEPTQFYRNSIDAFKEGSNQKEFRPHPAKYYCPFCAQYLYSTFPKDYLLQLRLNVSPPLWLKFGATL